MKHKIVGLVQEKIVDSIPETGVAESIVKMMLSIVLMQALVIGHKLSRKRV